MNDDLRNALKQLKCRASRGWEPLHLLPGEAQALLDERDVLRELCDSFIYVYDDLGPIGKAKMKQDARTMLRECTAAIAKTRNEETQP